MPTTLLLEPPWNFSVKTEAFAVRTWDVPRIALIMSNAVVADDAMPVELPCVPKCRPVWMAAE